MQPWLLLALAISCEITAAISLRYADGFTKPLPTLLALASFGGALYLVSLAVRTLPVSIAYPIWAGAGTAGVVAIGILVLGESANALKLGSIALIVLGVIGANLAAGGH